MSLSETAAFDPRDPAPGTPVFAEAWHAEVLALADALARSGLFSRADWAAALGSELRAAEHARAPDSGATYYAAALAALERLVAARAPEAGAALPGRVEAWRRAYINTPHGRPVELAAAEGYGGGEVDAHHHDHDDGHDHGGHER